MSNDYFEYLLTRSKKSYFLKRILHYPILGCFLKGKFLDVGCGIGDYLFSRPDGFGVDINLNQVSFCRARGLNVFMFDGKTIPFDKETFDSVLMDNVLEHIESPSDLLSEIKRVLAKKGSLVIGLPGLIGFNSDPDHKINYKASQLILLMNDCGFRVEKEWSFPIFLPSLFGRYLRSYCRYYLFRKV